jgi:hypothetical protein
MLMPFGRYKGRPLTEVPASYLWFAYREADLRPELSHAIADRLRNLLPPCACRMDHSVYRRELEAGYRQRVRKALRTVYYDLYPRCQPDRGGSIQAMTATRELYERFEDVLTQSA